ncbi:MAG: bifunctional DNA-formamidopyrimidine glycosylase/DNA-(apurinic or apyrimidinic site) lyase [Gemmatimonadaceae bacterium]|nr:bifunctional DNA-formamidopyrimidine glycosylase/DNA-(apurinic or apyrimidinic site) lyase [Gemmatimonadaceae bacterium]
MPELPETETIARDLHRELIGRRITGVEVTRPDVLREVDAAALDRRTSHATIVRCWRRAKLVVIELDTGDRLVVQPRFTGALLIDAGDMPERERRYSTLAFTLDDGRRLHYRDIRRLGTVSVMEPRRFEAYSASLGIEPLDPAFTAGALSGLLRVSRQPVKKVLMDQRAVVGIGNIYANEALWRAGIDPSRAARDVSDGEARRLRDAIVAVLTESIAVRGTSFRDYVDASGGQGGFVHHLAVYGRAGEPCPRCGARLVGTHAIDGRSTVLCARCQG